MPCRRSIDQLVYYKQTGDNNGHPSPPPWCSSVATDPFPQVTDDTLEGNMEPETIQKGRHQLGPATYSQVLGQKDTISHPASALSSQWNMRLSHQSNYYSMSLWLTDAGGSGLITCYTRLAESMVNRLTLTSWQPQHHRCPFWITIPIIVHLHSATNDLW